MAAEQELDRVDDEGDAADIENPKRDHRQREAKEKLDERRARRRQQRERQIHQPGQAAVVLAEPDHGDAQRHHGERRVHDPRGGIEMKAIEPVIDRLEQKRVDAPVANVLGDLEIVLVRHRQRVDQNQRDEVGHHAGEGVAREGLLPGEDRVPKKNRAEQRHETDQHAQQKIPAIDQIALHAEVENLGLEAKRRSGHKVPRFYFPSGVVGEFALQKRDGFACP